MDYPWIKGWPEQPAGTVARNILTLLAVFEMSQSELADQLRVAPSQVTKWLHQNDDQFTLKTLRKVSAALKVPVHILVVPVFEPRYREVSIVARLLHLLFRFRSHWGLIHRWMFTALDIVEEALDSGHLESDPSPFHLLQKAEGRTRSRHPKTTADPPVDA